MSERSLSLRAMSMYRAMRRYGSADRSSARKWVLALVEQERNQGE